jgi:hypothetical protein
VDWEEDGEQVGRTVPGCTVARPGGRAVDLSFFKTGTKPNPAPTETGLVGFMAERRYTSFLPSVFSSFLPSVSVYWDGVSGPNTKCGVLGFWAGVSGP